jgi:hypothetical protein
LHSKTILAFNNSLSLRKKISTYIEDEIGGFEEENDKFDAPSE